MRRLFALILALQMLLPAVSQARKAAPKAAPPATAAPAAPAGVPPELQPWIPWVLEKHPELTCPVTEKGATCLWPGVLALDVGPGGGRFFYPVMVDREMAVPLPGGKGAWPQDVSAGVASLVVLEKDGKPYVILKAGFYPIEGAFRWSQRPQAIPVPPLTARVALTLEGRIISHPRIDSQGTLPLGEGDVAMAEENRLDIEVSRRISDGVPVRIETRLALRASGSGREVDLGRVPVPGSRPVSLTADLPARFTPEGTLMVQVRAGSFTVSFDALYDGPVAALAAPDLKAPWPPQEYWAVATDLETRAVNLTGAPGVDPARTSLPDDWRTLPAYQVSPGTPLVFDELRRGEPDPAPSRLTLERTLWLDTTGEGLTVQDHITGTMSHGWRLDMLPPGELGHVRLNGTDQVITRSAAGLSGVEVRQSAVDLTADSRLTDHSFPAVGWDVDVQSLSATLHLPPGWSVLWGTGVDVVSGSVLANWSLFDLFFVLILGLATARLLGWRWGLLALMGLSLSRQQEGAPEWTWVVLLALMGLLAVIPKGRLHVALTWARWAVLGVLFLVLAPFALHEVRTGLYPVLEKPVSIDDFTDRFVQLDLAAPMDVAMEPQAPPPAQASTEGEVRGGMGVRSRKDKSGWDSDGKDYGRLSSNQGYLSLQFDPTSVVSTGPGVPNWRWDTQSLTWSGPVTRDHKVFLLLLGPVENGILAFLRVVLLLALGLRFAGIRRLPLKRLPAAALVLLVPGLARAEPSADTLKELETRLTAAPACAPACVAVPEMAVAVVEGRLVITAQAHAQVRSSWPVPGPADAWVPSAIQADGTETFTVARLEDGFLHVRLEPGVHRIRVEGPLPPTDALTLQIGTSPARMDWWGDGWTLDGLHADGTVERSVQLARVVSSASGVGSSSTDNLAPWLEVRRHLDLGIPWKVRSEVVRVGPASAPLSLKVPLLPGEAVTDESFQVTDGAVLVSLDRDRTSVAWISTLALTDSLVLTAPQGVPWTEQWTVSCSPVFACEATGLAPLKHVVDGAWTPRYRPWPGESITLAVTRPEAVPGQTITVDQVTLDVTPGRRLSEGSLTLQVRTSRGGQQVVTLPEGARLQEVTVNGEARPIQAREGQVPLPLQPGAQSLKVSWQESHAPSLFDRVPRVDVGSAATNASVLVHAPSERWILYLGGPSWGPVVLFWAFVVLVLGAAPFLSRLPWSPLRTWQWVLLGLGMTQVPAVCPAIVALWFVALGYRGARPFKNPGAFVLGQLGLILFTLVAMGCLYASIHAGLLFQPDMQIEGNGSSSDTLKWFVDRVDGPLPTPMVVSLPLWTWRVGMLLWSLWLAFSLLRWLPWGWRCFSAGGWWTPAAPAPAAAREAQPDDPADVTGAMVPPPDLAE